MDGVGTPIIGRPRPLPGHDTPNPANNTYTLNYEEPVIFHGVLKARVLLAKLANMLDHLAILCLVFCSLLCYII